MTSFTVAVRKQCYSRKSLLRYPALDQPMSTQFCIAAKLKPPMLRWLIAVPPGEERSTFAYSLCGFKDLGELALARCVS